MKERIGIVADLLMAAAYADHRLEGTEKTAVRKILGEVLGKKELPDDLAARVDAFVPDEVDVAKTAGQLKDLPEDQKLKLLELIASVHRADDEYDLAEDEFLAHVGQWMGLPEAAWKAMVAAVVEQLTLTEEDLAWLRSLK